MIAFTVYQIIIWDYAWLLSNSLYHVTASWSFGFEKIVFVIIILGRGLEYLFEVVSFQSQCNKSCVLFLSQGATTGKGVTERAKNLLE